MILTFNHEVMFSLFSHYITILS